MPDDDPFDAMLRPPDPLDPPRPGDFAPVQDFYAGRPPARSATIDGPLRLRRLHLDKAQTEALARGEALCLTRLTRLEGVDALELVPWKPPALVRS